ncbi:MAG: LPS assembly lipoprotein LptE [Gammaproteobacteria bacterium]
MTFRFCLLFILAASLSACGFQLRGSNLESLKDSQVYIMSTGANELAAQVKTKLAYAEIPIAQDPNQADYVIELGQEKFERSVLSVSAETGKVEEYEITYNALLSVSGPDGKILLKNEPLMGRRDFTFEEDSVLGKFDEENIIHEELTRHVADTVLRRLRAVTR